MPAVTSGRSEPGAAARRSAVGLLTHKQLECLRLVQQYGTDKRIAEQLGISYKTVGNHITAGMKRLGVSDRYEAARRVQNALGGNYPRAPEPIALPAAASNLDWSEAVKRQPNDTQSVHETVASFDRSPPALRNWDRFVRDGTGAKGNQLSVAGRLKWIGLAALAAILLVFLVIAAAESLNRTFSSFGFTER